MLQISNRTSFVCWPYFVCRPSSNNLIKNRQDRTFTPRLSYHLKQKSICVSTRSFATVQNHTPNLDGLDARQRGEQRRVGTPPPIRDRLRQWEKDNPDEAQAILLDVAENSEFTNILTHPQNLSMTQFDDPSLLFDGDELGELRSDDNALDPGDLVEIRSENSRRPILAICLGRLNGYDHFYTNSGKWFFTANANTLFVVKKFATPFQISSVIAELPSTGVSAEALNVLHDLGHGPSRLTGASLLQKMLRFDHDAESIYQANAGTLDASSSFIGDPVKHRYLTLHEIADLLLPPVYKKDGKYSRHALYAVHRSLMLDEIFFRPMGARGLRGSYLFEISPLSEVRTIQKVERAVRHYMERNSSTSTTQSSTGQKTSSANDLNQFDGFLTRARQFVDQSRKTREWSNSGIIGPSKGQLKRNGLMWSDTDLVFLDFVELWASYRKFPAYSRLQTIGSTVLRAIDRYQDADVLGWSTGWTFLQEIGWIPPWEIPARYTMRFPDVGIQRGAGYIRPVLGSLDGHLKRDKMAQIREKLAGRSVYCIDAETTLDVDDGISLEKTANPDQYWIHIHVADPASSIYAETPLAKYAELIPETIYLSGHFERMLPAQISEKQFSLGPNKRCLTFSALVNKGGELLDKKIMPQTLEDVLHITGEEVNTAIGDQRLKPVLELLNDSLTLGGTVEAVRPQKTMTRSGDLSAEQKTELGLLNELGQAIEARRLKKGATIFSRPRYDTQVSFSGVKQTKLNEATTTSGDPSISVKHSGNNSCSLVAIAMQLAGEVAALWCHERGIAVPFRTQPRAAKNAEELRQYTRDVLYPTINNGGYPNDKQWQQLFSLIGSSQISTTASPHVTIGVDMYTKATSPLRRFSDMIVHWQIEGALLEEHRRGGKSLVGNEDESFLPFTREHLSRMIPMLLLREKQTRALNNVEGPHQWTLQALVRAWRFGEAPLPATFRFTVRSIIGRQSLMGRINWFDLNARLLSDSLNGVVRMAEVRVGDVLEVKLKDVNVYHKQIKVEALRGLEKMAASKDKEPVRTILPDPSAEIASA